MGAFRRRSTILLSTYRLLATLMPCAMVGTLAGPAFAQPTAAAKTEPDDAKRIVHDEMQAGIAEYQNGNLEAARQHYERAWQVQKHPAIAASIGEVHMRLGQYLDAAPFWKFYVDNAPKDDKRIGDAQRELDECMKHVGRVRFTVNVEGATIRVGNRVVGTSPLDEEVLVDPGEQEFHADKDGYESGVRVASVPTGGSVLNVPFELRALPADEATEPVATPAANATLDEADASGLDTKTMVLVGGGALTLIGVGLGAYFLVQRSSAYDEHLTLGQKAADAAGPGWDGDCEGTSSARPVAECNALNDKVKEGEADQRNAYIAFGAAGVVAAASVAAYFLWPSAPKQKHETAQWSLAPWSAQNLNGVQVQGTF